MLQNKTTAELQQTFSRKKKLHARANGILNILRKITSGAKIFYDC